MKITKADVGRKVKLRDGGIGVIKSYYGCNDGMPVWILFKDRESCFTTDGHYWPNKNYSDNDAISFADLKIEAGKFYRSKCGKKVHVVGRSEDGKHWVVEALNGQECDANRLYRIGDDGNNIAGNDFWHVIEEWKESRRIVGWLNLDEDGCHSFYDSREEADEDKSSDRIACVKIDVTEGEGLEGSK